MRGRVGLSVSFRKASGAITPCTEDSHCRQLLFLSFHSILSSGIKPGCLHSSITCRGFCVFTCPLWSTLFLTSRARAHTLHTHLSTRMVPTADPALFRVVDGRVKLTWRDRFPAYFTNLVSIIFMVSPRRPGAVYQGRRRLLDGVSHPRGGVFIPGRQGWRFPHPKMGRGPGFYSDPRGSLHLGDSP